MRHSGHLSLTECAIGSAMNAIKTKPKKVKTCRIPKRIEENIVKICSFMSNKVKVVSERRLRDFS